MPSLRWGDEYPLSRLGRPLQLPKQCFRLEMIGGCHAPRSKSATSRERWVESREHFEPSLFDRKTFERYDRPTAAILVPSHCANVMPGSSPMRSFTSQISRWYVTRPCSLKESRVNIRSWRCSGDGNDNEVPGIGKDGAKKWGLEAIIGEPWIFSNESVEVRTRCDIALSQWIPGKSRMLSVCSTIALRCPSVSSDHEYKVSIDLAILFCNAPKNSLSHMSSTSVQTRKAVKSVSFEFWPIFGGSRRKRVHIIASGLGTSTELSWRDSLWMSLMTEREVAVIKGFS